MSYFMLQVLAQVLAARFISLNHDAINPVCCGALLPNSPALRASSARHRAAIDNKTRPRPRPASAPSSKSAARATALPPASNAGPDAARRIHRSARRATSAQRTSDNRQSNRPNPGTAPGTWRSVATAIITSIKINVKIVSKHSAGSIGMLGIVCAVGRVRGGHTINITMKQTRGKLRPRFVRRYTRAHSARGKAPRGRRRRA